MRPHNHHTTGFSFIEVLVVVAIIGVLAALGVLGFRNFVYSQSLQTATQDLYTTLSDARSATLASEYGAQFGVYIEPNRITRFRGSTYSSASPFNQVIDFRGITVTHSLSGGATILFEKQTGRTTNSGTITLTNQTTLASQTVTLYSSGIISVP